MAITAKNNISPVDFIARADRENEIKTIFKIKPLDGFQSLEVMNELTRDELGLSKLSAKGLKLALNYGLEGWDNCLDVNGNRIPYSKVNVSMLPPAILGEIASEIINITMQ